MSANSHGPKHLFLPGSENPLCRRDTVLARAAKDMSEVTCCHCRTTVSNVARLWRVFSTAEMAAAEMWLAGDQDAIAVVQDSPPYAKARTVSAMKVARRRLSADGAPLKDNGTKLILKNETARAAVALCALNNQEHAS